MNTRFDAIRYYTCIPDHGINTVDGRIEVPYLFPDDTAVTSHAE